MWWRGILSNVHTNKHARTDAFSDDDDFSNDDALSDGHSDHMRGQL